MGLINNVNIESLLDTVEQAKRDLDETKRTTGGIERWTLDGGRPQFVAEIRYEKGFSVLEADQPSFKSGEDTRPGPMHYCLCSLLSSLAATLTTVAAQEGIKLKRLEVTVEGSYNYSKTFGTADRPVVEEVGFKVKVDSSMCCILPFVGSLKNQPRVTLNWLDFLHPNRIRLRNRTTLGNKTKAIPLCDQNCRLACKQCQSCLHNCPTGAIQFERGFPVIDPEKCRGMSCLVCVKFCPHNALKVVLNDYDEEVEE